VISLSPNIHKLYSALALLCFALLCASFCSSFVVAQEHDVVTVKLKTTRGSILLELYPQKAPSTVNNFLRYVRARAYNGGEFYRSVTEDNDNGSPKIEVIQGGAKENTVRFEPIPHESTLSSGIQHVDGVISMARAEPGTAQTDFFICIGDQPSLNYGGKRNVDGLGFAAFGRVIAGMDIIREIHELPTTKQSDDEYLVGQILSKPAKIISIEIVD